MKTQLMILGVGWLGWLSAVASAFILDVLALLVFAVLRQSPATESVRALVRIAICVLVFLLVAELLYRRNKTINAQTGPVCTVYDREGMHAINLHRSARRVRVWERKDGYYVTSPLGLRTMAEFIPWRCFVLGTPDEFRVFAQSMPNYRLRKYPVFPYWAKVLVFAVGWIVLSMLSMAAR